MHTLFISDLHLSQERPEITQSFLKFLSEQATSAEALYILGDLFEVWIGDSPLMTEQHQTIIDGLRRLTDHGIPVFIMHGNRDFLLGNDFELSTGCRLISDPTVIDLYGTPTLLMHGDTLCTDDVGYQAFRQQVRDPKWQQQFLSMPVEQRLQMANQARQESKKHTSETKLEIMDVNDQAVQAIMQEYNINRLIHGHTHRPAIHNITINQQPAQRILV